LRSVAGELGYRNRPARPRTGAAARQVSGAGRSSDRVRQGLRGLMGGDQGVSGWIGMDRIKVVAEKVKQFLVGSKVELKKVTWPTPKQTLASTSVVIIVVIIVSVFLGIVDFGLVKIVKLILG